MLPESSSLLSWFGDTMAGKLDKAREPQAVLVMLKWKQFAVEGSQVKIGDSLLLSLPPKPP